MKPRYMCLLAAAAALLTFQTSALCAQSQAAAAGYSASRIEGKTEVEKAIGKCVAAVALGALLGAFAGGRRNAGQGAAIGAAAGLGVCAVMLAVASNQDKQRLRDLQLKALNSGETQTDRWTTTDGHDAVASVTPSRVVQVTAPKTAEQLNCRKLNTALSGTGEPNNSSDIVCLHGDSWVTLDKLKDLGVRSSDVTV